MTKLSLILVFAFALNFVSVANAETNKDIMLNSDISCTQTTTTTTTTHANGSVSTTQTTVVTCDTPLELIEFLALSKK